MSDIVHSLKTKPGGEGAEAQANPSLPSSTPEYAPASQIIVEEDAGGNTSHTDDAPPQNAENAADAATSEPGLDNAAAPPAPAPTAASPAAAPASSPFSAAADGDTPAQRLYQLIFEEVSRDPRFELNTNVRQILDEVRHLRAASGHDGDQATHAAELATIRATAQSILARLEGEGEGKGREGKKEKGQAASDSQPSTGRPLADNNPQPSLELIHETRALIRSVNEDVNAARNNLIQLTNQTRMVMDVTTRCLREMDKTARKYEQQGETGPLLDELRSLRDMLATGFENARLEPIAPEPGETFRYADHRAESGFASSGKIKRTLYPGFRWTQPTPPVVLLPAIVETE